MRRRVVGDVNGWIVFGVLIGLLLVALAVSALLARRRRPVVRFDDRVVGTVLATHIDERGITVDIELTDPALLEELHPGNVGLSVSLDPDTTVELVARDDVDDEGDGRG
jgi:hypothetical protein